MSQSLTATQRRQQEAIAQADKVQREASDPRASVFVSASAGSGKTKLLIDRLLRLMLPLEDITPEGERVLLEGSDPARILCLTYTKAAAAEMANRLQDRLGRWVSLEPEKLGQELRALDVPDTEHTRARARSLFLKVLDLPGGLRVETIHAFCQSLLRRFPLEAALDPHFALMEETDSALALRQALEQELSLHPAHAQGLASVATFSDVVERVTGFNEKIARLQPLVTLWNQRPQQVIAAYRRLLKAGDEDAETVECEAVCLPNEEAIREGLKAAWPKMSDAGRKKGQQFLDWLATPVEERVHGVLLGLLLTDKGTPRKMGSIVAKAAQPLAPGLVEALEQEAQRQLELRELIRAQQLLQVNQALLGLSAPVLSRFQKEKTQRGLVDYNDLIAHTRDLLRDPGAAWVMYKLDGGIDHLLLDEVQDTSALQWEIAGALTSDFFSGEGRHEDTPRPRTIFAVGDFKQSIYSFQGAEPEQFHKWRKEFARRVTSAGLLWREPTLKVSFRSVAPVLSVVDGVFQQDIAAYGLREAGTKTLEEHVSARPGQGGRVELWPCVPAKDEGGNPNTDEESSPWRAPLRNSDKRSAPQRLAESLAEWISTQIGRSPQPGKPPLRAGDVLVLVPKRSTFLRAFIRALKTRQVPVASFIRSGLTEQVAVRDLMTLCAALLLPQDDLSVASVLTSPLGGLSDDSLMDLATHDRKKAALGSGGTSLWSLLRERHSERAEWRSAWENLSALYRRVDYDTPYQILVQALGAQGGRARLLARLGPEAAEPVDELLNAALNYEMQHAPSLQGFLQWLEASETTSRREPESDVDAVRIMTVHGSKGLQARLVVLPDTTSTTERDRDVLWPHEGGMDVPLWVPRKKEMGTQRTAQITQEAAEKSRAEKNRLLYVALTRASDMLVICGWEPARGAVGETSWYEQCRQGFAQLENVQETAFEGGWSGTLLSLEERCTETSPPQKTSTPHQAPIIVPSWMGQAPDWRAEPAPQEDALARPLTPSRPDGAEFGPSPAARSPLDVVQGNAKERPLKSDGTVSRQKAMQRGRLVHRLLQLLPEMPVQERAQKAYHWLSRPAWKLEKEDVSQLCEHILAVLNEPRLEPLFGPHSRSEQAISGVMKGAVGQEGQVVLGKVDRFCLEDDAVWLCDYKTGRRPPREVTQTPSAYLRQMAAYRAVMAQVYPDKEIRCFLVWTEGPQVDELPRSLLEPPSL
ncbi:double-strand break repair helicase AddA [Saccharibacter floricola]|uniref:DNA 3'-5' helicase n=1 Tax=Saccharibacter floricola DSM 15669 TaxID=1123227 RepID=A0ABQ0NXM8_9PROT|nr:double-strand break repair helicase AddA [Saccharibacter floricola]GBQ05953.1 DNA helicase II [Saccharibacter floricola DSM 15669]